MTLDNELCLRASSSDLTDHDPPSSGEEDEDIFGDDELTDGKSSSERSSTDREEMSTLFKSPGPSLRNRKSSVSQPSDLDTLQTGPSQPKLKRYGLKLLIC